MDKQINTVIPPANLIPVNTRTIGAPEGIYILYLEDYVHTFIKKILPDTDVHGAAYEMDGEYHVDQNLQPAIALYGRSVEENGRYRLVVSGAAALGSDSNKIQQLNDTYFPSCTYIGTAYASRNKDLKLRLELVLNNMKVIVDDFYIYYDQNEEMQNYLIEWNTNTHKEKNRDKTILSAAESGSRIRNNVDDAARLGRLAQAYNREEARVSFMWNIMNALCLGFIVCVMAYGIVSVNNYNKMQNMQASIDYCMAFVAEHTSFELQTAPVMQQSVQLSDTEALQQSDPIAEQETPQNIQATEETLQNIQATEEEIPTQPIAQTETVSSGQTAAEDIQSEKTSQQPTAEDIQDESVQASQQAEAQPKQYYIVRKGDTLRTICYNIYGNYSRVDEICQLNNIEDPDNILYGQKLLLP